MNVLVTVVFISGSPGSPKQLSRNLLDILNSDFTVQGKYLVTCTYIFRKGNYIEKSVERNLKLAIFPKSQILCNGLRFKI